MPQFYYMLPVTISIQCCWFLLVGMLWKSFYRHEFSKKIARTKRCYLQAWYSSFCLYICLSSIKEACVWSPADLTTIKQCESMVQRGGWTGQASESPEQQVGISVRTEMNHKWKWSFSFLPPLPPPSFCQVTSQQQVEQHTHLVLIYS